MANLLKYCLTSNNQMDFGQMDGGLGCSTWTVCWYKFLGRHAMLVAWHTFIATQGCNMPSCNPQTSMAPSGLCSQSMHACLHPRWPVVLQSCVLPFHANTMRRSRQN